ncbi:hypothetical protein M231_04373 [Tremella mesenterica]|uniref:Uncharacterized protein n=1 Tax=Tremella mesenterica TaxID=5217 RepID=A0A4Q1BKM4_TREME|nr:hypothetical protein M231_04373 [Tremella mesenterica]
MLPLRYLLFLVSTLGFVVGNIGRIYSIQAPSILHPGKSFEVKVFFTKFDDHFQELGLLFGLKNSSIVCTSCVGEPIGYFNLYRPGESFKDIRKYSLRVPSDVEGDYTLVASFASVEGVEAQTLVQVVNQYTAHLFHSYAPNLTFDRENPVRPQESISTFNFTSPTTHNTMKNPTFTLPVIVALLTCVAGYPGIITQVEFPDVLVAGDNIDITIHYVPVSDSYEDLGIVWGLKPQELDCGPYCTGEVLGYSDLYGPDDSFHQDYTVNVHLPRSFQGEYTLISSIFYREGSDSTTGFRALYKNVTIVPPPPHPHPDKASGYRRARGIATVAGIAETHKRAIAIIHKTSVKSGAKETGA